MSINRKLSVINFLYINYSGYIIYNWTELIVVINFESDFQLQ
jgi:hypothetical protein